MSRTAKRVGGVDAGDAKHRTGIDDHAPRPALDHGDMGMAKNQHAGIALVPECVDRGRQRLVGGDDFGVRGGRAMVKLDDLAIAFQAKPGGQGPEKLPGVVVEQGALPAADPDNLPALQSPAVVIAPDAGMSRSRIAATTASGSLPYPIRSPMQMI